jgi:hypothetical protein
MHSQARQGAAQSFHLNSLAASSLALMTRLDPDAEGIAFSCSRCDEETAGILGFAADCRVEIRARREWEATRN